MLGPCDCEWTIVCGYLIHGGVELDGTIERVEGQRSQIALVEDFVESQVEFSNVTEALKNGGGGVVVRISVNLKSVSCT